jgi:hypothetical protein
VQLRLDFYAPKPPPDPTIWTGLTPEQKRAAVTQLAKLIAAAAAAERDGGGHESDR